MQTYTDKKGIVQDASQMVGCWCCSVTFLCIQQQKSFEYKTNGQQIRLAWHLVTRSGSHSGDDLDVHKEVNLLKKVHSLASM
jgi:hypothetical protein